MGPGRPKPGPGRPKSGPKRPKLDPGRPKLGLGRLKSGPGKPWPWPWPGAEMLKPGAGMLKSSPRMPTSGPRMLKPGPGKPKLSLGRLKPGSGRAQDRWTEIPPCVLQDIVPLGAAVLQATLLLSSVCGSGCLLVPQSIDPSVCLETDGHILGLLKCVLKCL